LHVDPGKLGAERHRAGQISVNVTWCGTVLDNCHVNASARLYAMSSEGKINLNYAEAMTAILARYLVMADQDDDVEVHAEMIVDTGIFGDFEDVDDKTSREIARILRQQVSIARRKSTTPQEVVSYADSLPTRLREKTFAAFVIFVVGLHVDEELKTESYNTFDDVRRLLGVTKELADQIVQVAKIMARRIA
jgi:hypothetical protein